MSDIAQAILWCERGITKVFFAKAAPVGGGVKARQAREKSAKEWNRNNDMYILSLTGSSKICELYLAEA